jgi:hypothetical protein
LFRLEVLELGLGRLRRPLGRLQQPGNAAGECMEK